MGQNLLLSLIGEYLFLGIPLAIIAASIIGSTHCLSMCGPIALLVKNNRLNIYLYHAGRLFSYIFLGLGAGFAGERFLSISRGYISVISVILISLVYIYLGSRLILEKPLHFNLFNKISSNLYKLISYLPGKFTKSFFIGIINGLIPCGWLYIFVAGSASTKNPVYGALFMSLFWIGTLPALSLFPSAINVFNRKLKFPLKTTAIAGTIIILIGISNTLVHKNALNNYFSDSITELCGSGKLF